MQNIVIKFGGSILKNENDLIRITKILNHYANRNILIVVSAIGGVTGNIIKIIDYIYKEKDYLEIYNQLENMHFKFSGMIKNINVKKVVDNRLKKEFETFKLNLLKIINETKSEKYSKKYSGKSKSANALLERILITGERLSSILINGILKDNNFISKIFYPEEFNFYTDGNFFNSTVDLKKDEVEKIYKKFNYFFLNDLASNNGEWDKNKHIIIIPGFYGISRDNFINTFGRDGSDYTASIIASILKSDRVDYFKDVDGLCSFDPVVKTDKKNKKQLKPIVLGKVRYHTAFNFSKYGIKIISKKALIPLKLNNIPTIFLNFNKYFENNNYKNTIVYSFNKEMEDKYILITILDNVKVINKNKIFNNKKNQNFNNLKYKNKCVYELIDIIDDYCFIKMKRLSLVDLGENNSIDKYIEQKGKLISIFFNNNSNLFNKLINHFEVEIHSMIKNNYSVDPDIIKYRKKDSIHIFYSNKNSINMEVIGTTNNIFEANIIKIFKTLIKNYNLENKFAGSVE